MDIVLAMIDFFSTKIPNIQAFILWLVLLALSGISIKLIKETYNSYSDDGAYTRVLHAAVIFGLVITAFVFHASQHINMFCNFLGRSSAINVLAFLLFSFVGYFIWYAQLLNKLGDFFDTLLLVSIIGFTWYARLEKPDQVFDITTALILGSISYRVKIYVAYSKKEKWLAEFEKKINQLTRNEKKHIYDRLFRKFL